MRYLAPALPQDALTALAGGEFRILAGGTDFYPSLRDRPVTENILDISRIADFRSISYRAGSWRLGAAVTWSELIRHPLPALFSGLKQAASEVGSVQIQNTGTIAGNLCNASPAADGVPALLALDAKVEISSLKGHRQLALSDFITGVRETALKKGEMVTAILVADGAGHSIFEKLGSRRYLVISIVSAAALIVPDANRTSVAKARIAIGACSAVATRLENLEAALIGAPLRGGEIAATVRPEHFSVLSPLDDVRGDAGFRRQSALELTRRILGRLATQIQAGNP